MNSQTDIRAVHHRLDDFGQQLYDLRKDVGVVWNEVILVRGEVGDLRNEVGGLKNDVGWLKRDIDSGG